jgi:hypothetical protein
MPRRYHGTYVEYFSGVQSITTAMKKSCFRTAPYDIELHEQMDMNSSVGLLVCVHYADSRVKHLLFVPCRNNQCVWCI